MEPNRITKVTDEKILGRVLDEFARTKLMQIDLNGVVDELEEIPMYSYTKNLDYRPTQIYINGTALGYSRWPNNEEGSAWLRIGGNINTETENYTFDYLDETDRAKLWSAEAFDDLYIDGYINNYFSNEIWKVQDIDIENKIITAPTGSAKPAADHRLYFFNLIDEIDQPGESYIDRENKIVYFYPPADMDTADVHVSTMTDTMVTLSGVSYVNFKGLDFECTRGDVITGTDCTNMTFDDLTIAHISGNAMNVVGGSRVTNLALVNSHVYDIGFKGITLGGGSWAPYTASGNRVENCRIHSCGRIFKAYAPAIAGVGMDGEIKNNKLYDSDHMLVGAGTGTQILNNEIYNAVLQSSDMGAIYWGRGVYTMGNTIKYNYFHDIGNIYGGYGQQAIFWDDFATGPEIYGNIFYRATAQNGDTGQSFAIKTNNGAFSRVHNNIFVENPTAAFFQFNSDDNFKWPSRGKWWLWAVSANDYNSDMMNYYHLNANLQIDSWAERYAGTLWQPLTDHSLFPAEALAKVRELDKAGDKEGLIKLANQYAPEGTNDFYNNVLVNIKQGGNGCIGNVDSYDLFRSDDTSIFKAYGSDFGLTSAGLAEVNKSIEFENIDMSTIGLRTAVGGTEPTVANLSIAGNKAAGGVVRADYDFVDPDGDTEGISKISWYTVDKKGKLTPLGKHGRELKIEKDWEGMKISYSVTPHDSNGLYGEEVTSEAAEVESGGAADKTSLWNAITEADTLLANATAGDEEGQYPQAAIDALGTAVDAARTVANTSGLLQYEVNDATTTLQNAIDEFLAAQITNLDKYMSIKPQLADTANWKKIAGDGEITFENGSMTIPDGACVSYTGERFGNKLFTFRVKFEKENAENALNSAIYFRLGNPDNRIWSNNSGYLLWIKDATLEYQKWAPGQDLISYDNDWIQAGTEYEITVGVYDMADDKVKYELWVDGEKVYEKEVTGANLHGEEGYLSFSTAGATMTITPVEVDTSTLESVLAEARQLQAEAEIGEGYGQYSSIEPLDNAITTAAGILADGTQIQEGIDRAAAALRRTLNSFIGTANTEEEVNESKTIAINYKLANGLFRIATGIDLKLQLDLTQEQPGLKTETATANGTVTMELMRGTRLSGGSSLFQAPLYGTTPSRTIENATINGVYKAGSEGMTANHAVRLVLPGQAGKTVAYLENGKYKTVNKRLSTDSQAAADAELLPEGGTRRIDSGNDLILWTTVLGEFVTYTKTDVVVTPPVTGPGYGSNTGSTGSTGSTGTGLLGNTTPPAKNRFTDTIGHWAQADIEEMAEKGIVTGVTATTFEPDRSITRAEFATLIVKALGLESRMTAGFSDVAADAWYYPYVNAAANVGIIAGYDGTFRPDDRITREEMAVILGKATVFMEKKAGRGAIARFADSTEISDWAYEYVDEAATAGLISGMPDGTFAPHQYTTRAQAASVIKRLLNI